MESRTDQKPPKQKKNPRSVTLFSDNVTASLMAAKKQMDIEGAPNVILQLLAETAKSIHQKIIAPTKITDTKNKIDDEHHLFHLEIEKLESQMTPTKDADLDDEIQLKKVEMIKAQIVEHAARRVDLFFYLILAVRGKKIKIEKDETVKQHGKGSIKRGTHGCHSSLFPHLKFSPMIAPSASNASWLTSLLQSAMTSSDYIFKSTPISPPPFPTFSGTYFEDALNMTVELPSVVNAFDGHLEGRFKLTEFADDCLQILNKISNDDRFDPITAMNQFFKIMFSFFDHIRRNYLKKPHRMDYPKTFPKIWEYEREGTFIAADMETLTMKNDYLALMLRLNRVERIKSVYSLEPYYQRIQDEIYANKSPDQSSKMNAASLKKT